MLPYTTVLTKNLNRDLSLKITLIPYWNDFNPISLGRCGSEGRLRKYANNLNSDNFGSALNLTSLSRPYAFEFDANMFCVFSFFLKKTWHTSSFIPLTLRLLLSDSRGGWEALPYVGRYHLPVSWTLFLRKSYTQWPCFSLQSTPNDPLFQNFNLIF